MKKTKRASSPQLSVVLLAAVVAFVGLVVFLIGRRLPSREHMAPETYFGSGGVAVVKDGELTEIRGQLIDGEVYLPYGTLTQDLNPAVFYDENENLLIKTHDAVLDARPVDQAEGLIKDGDTLLIAFSALSENTDISGELLEAPDRFLISTRELSYHATVISDKAVMRYRAGIKSPIVRDLVKGEELAVLGAETLHMGKQVSGWVYACTPDGFAGYIKEEDMSETVITPSAPMPAGESGPRLHLLYHQTDSQAANDALAVSMEGVSGVDVILPTWFFLTDESGEMSSLASASYVETAHQMGLQVWAVMNDFDGGISSASATESALSSFSGRQRIIEKVMQGILESGADGVNVDFENVSSSCAPYFLEMIRELAVSCTREGKVLSICDYVPTYTKYLNRAEQARVADYIICMCYDEHTRGSKEAGSVSSIGFVKQGISDTLLEVPASKTIIALPFYTRLFISSGSDAPDSRAMGMREAWQYAEDNDMAISWDEECLQYYAEKTVDAQLYQVWLEDVTSLEEKLKEVLKYDCAGVADWKLGLQSNDVWEMMANQLK